jgi:oxygen-independent coproporphyrinogen-3 oxidase
LATDVEITLEANPGTAEAERFSAYRAAGVNRISLGIQSFDDERLKALGRIHSAQEARFAYGLARGAGFDNINLDLMFGLPGQTVVLALNDIQAAIELVPEHISWYQLTLEPNTAFYRQPPALPDDECTWAMQERGQAMLEEAGYKQYEISAYAKPQQQCRHNRNYWEFGDYLGIGAGAHSKLTDVETQKIERLAKIKNPQQYQKAMDGNSMLESHEITAEADLPFEFMMNALRLIEGVPSAYFSARTGLPLSVCSRALDTARLRGLLEFEDQGFRPSALGSRFLNDLLCLFLNDPVTVSVVAADASILAIPAANARSLSEA